MTTQPQGFWEAGDLISLARMLLLTTQRGPAPSSTNAAGYDADTDTTWVPYGGAPLAGLRGYDSTTGRQWFTYKEGDHIIVESVSLPEDAPASVPSLRTLVDPANLPRFTETPVPTVTGGSGAGAVIDSIVVTDGRITEVRWGNPRGSGYQVGDVLTFAQGTLAIEYTLTVADVASGIIQNFDGVSIGDSRAGNEDRVGATGNHGHTADQLNIQTDGPANVGSLRTLDRAGLTPAQRALAASPGNHEHSDYTAVVFDASGTWTKPADADVRTNVPVLIFAIGGGGGGAHGSDPAFFSEGALYGGGGGGGGGALSVGIYSWAELDATLNITIGAGGDGGAIAAQNGSNGGNTRVLDASNAEMLQSGGGLGGRNARESSTGGDGGLGGTPRFRLGKLAVSYGTIRGGVGGHGTWGRVVGSGADTTLAHNQDPSDAACGAGGGGGGGSVNQDSNDALGNTPNASDPGASGGGGGVHTTLTGIETIRNFAPTIGDGGNGGNATKTNTNTFTTTAGADGAAPGGGGGGGGGFGVPDTSDRVLSAGGDGANGRVVIMYMPRI